MESPELGAGVGDPILPARTLVSISDVSRELGLSPSRIRQLVELGEIPVAGRSPGGHRRFDLAAVRDAQARRQLARTSLDPDDAEPLWSATYPLRDADEDEVWQHMRGAFAVPTTAEAIARYVVTEMVNNAIDHSGGTFVVVSVGRDKAGHLHIRIIDDGDGVFRHLAAGLHLDGELAALAELTKGKQTTDPDRHTGEGIFFASKVVDQFAIAANGLRLTFDNVRDDFAAGTAAVENGTTVGIRLDPATTTTLADVFARYTDDFAFSRTRPRIKLYELGVSFVSRSEAKRLAAGLEHFRDVDLDFARVNDVGQGFADELFRVWATAHPDVILHPTDMNEAVAFMVNRAIERRAAT